MRGKMPGGLACLRVCVPCALTDLGAPQAVLTWWNSHSGTFVNPPEDYFLACDLSVLGWKVHVGLRKVVGFLGNGFVQDDLFYAM